MLMWMLQDPTKQRACHRLFLAVSILRFTAASHIILAGLELDIHDPNELPFVYWHGAVVYNTLNDALQALRKVCEHASPILCETVCLISIGSILMRVTVDYLFYEMMWSSLMGQYFMACCTVRPASKTYSAVLIKSTTQTSLLLNRTPDAEPRREETNFHRRFKWVFLPESVTDPCTPRFSDWKAFRDEQRGEGVVGERVQTAGEVFVKLEESLVAYEEVVRAEQFAAGVAADGVEARAGVGSPTVLEQSARLRLEVSCLCTA